MTSDRRNFLYRIFDCIADQLHKEHAIYKLKDGGGDMSLANKYLDDIMVKCQASKTITNFLKNVLKTLLQKIQDVHFKNFFGDFHANLEVMEDESLKE